MLVIEAKDLFSLENTLWSGMNNVQCGRIKRGGKLGLCIFSFSFRVEGPSTSIRDIN